MLLCDTIQVQQVLMNLLGNAIDSIVGGQHAGSMARGGRIAIRVEPDETRQRLVISVRDNGPGIAPDLATRVFEPLTTAKPGGLGLGLSVCALIVEAHEGRIWLETSRPGATEFRFWLPLAAQGNDNRPGEANGG